MKSLGANRESESPSEAGGTLRPLKHQQLNRANQRQEERAHGVKAREVQELSSRWVALTVHLLHASLGLSTLKVSSHLIMTNPMEGS